MVIRKCIATLMCAAFVIVSFNAQPVKAADKKDLGIPIDAEHFPDANFRKCVATNSDTDKNGYLDNQEILYTWNVYCENSDVYSIEGIGYFPYLKGLWCKGNHIKEMDLSGNPDLEGVWCSFNDLTEIDFSPCKKLSWVYCFNCKLEKLDFTNNPKLAYLECNANPNLRTIDVSHNPELENLFCSECALTELDVSHNPLLCELTCFKNNLKSLDVSHNPLIKRLDIWWNEELGDVDVSNLKEMQYYNIGKTAAKHVNIKNNKHLLEFVCNYNDGVTSLNLSGNPDLAYLALECDTKLKSLDLSHNPKLYYLMAFGLSSIKKIDLSKNYRLCKAYNEGKYVHETENLGYVYSKTLDYGGSSDPFDELRHCVALDDRISGSKVNAKFNGKKVPDCSLDTKDGLSNKETFITRGQAIQTLYEIAGKPKASKKTRFKDVPSDASYYDAVRWGEANKICFGYPVICDNEFNGEELINRQDWALMAHRFADLYKLGTALDYGRSDWYKDSLDMDFYSWAPFTWALQWKIVHIEDKSTHCYPHGRITYKEFKNGLKNLMDIDSGATYAQRVGGNFGAEGDPDATEKQGTGYINNKKTKDIKIVIAKTYPGTTKNKKTKQSSDTQNLSGVKISALKARVYTGKAIRPAFKLKDGKKTLKKGVDYTVKFTNNINVGVATVKFTGKGNYTGTLKKTFKIKPKGTSIKKMVAKAKACTVTWRPQRMKMKSSPIKGYQIQYSVSKAFASGNKIVNVAKYSTTKKTVKNLAKGKKYYVRIRTYKVVKGVKYYSSWSAAKTLKTKAKSGRGRLIVTMQNGTKKELEFNIG